MKSKLKSKLVAFLKEAIRAADAIFASCAEEALLRRADSATAEPEGGASIRAR